MLKSKSLNKKKHSSIDNHKAYNLITEGTGLRNNFSDKIKKLKKIKPKK